MDINWGYSVSRARNMDVDRNDLFYARQIFAEVPELNLCIGCGSCTAGCTAGNLTSFNFRKVQTLIRRGEYSGAYDELGKCMLCGKCQMSCPRGINTRSVIRSAKKILGEYNRFAK